VRIVAAILAPRGRSGGKACFPLHVDRGGSPSGMVGADGRKDGGCEPGTGIGKGRRGWNKGGNEGRCLQARKG
jgi:hypothetical protein